MFRISKLEIYSKFLYPTTVIAPHIYKRTDTKWLAINSNTAKVDLSPEAASLNQFGLDCCKVTGICRFVEFFAVAIFLRIIKALLRNRH